MGSADRRGRQDAIKMVEERRRKAGEFVRKADVSMSIKSDLSVFVDADDEPDFLWDYGSMVLGVVMIWSLQAALHYCEIHNIVLVTPETAIKIESAVVQFTRLIQLPLFIGFCWAYLPRKFGGLQILDCTNMQSPSGKYFVLAKKITAQTGDIFSTYALEWNAWLGKTAYAFLLWAFVFVNCFEVVVTSYFLKNWLTFWVGVCVCSHLAYFYYLLPDSWAKNDPVTNAMDTYLTKPWMFYYNFWVIVFTNSIRPKKGATMSKKWWFQFPFLQCISLLPTVVGVYCFRPLAWTFYRNHFICYMFSVEDFRWAKRKFTQYYLGGKKE